MRLNYKYLEKKGNESYAYVFKNLEIKQYLQKYLKNHGLILHSHKIYISGSVLEIFISIYETERAHFILKNKLEKIKRLNKNLKSNNTLKKYIKQQLKTKSLGTIKKKINNAIKKKVANVFSKQNLLKNLNLFTNYKFNINLKINQINNIKQINNVIENTNKKQYNKKLNSNFNLLNNNNLNKNYLKLNQINLDNQKLTVFRIRKFERTPFFREGKHLFLPLITQNNSTYLLATFIAIQLKNLKQHNFFFNFIKESLSLTICQKFSKVQGLKLIIKGRLNNSARAKQKIISIGKIPLITIKSKIDYAQSTAFTANGTFGIKVWICYK